MIVWKIRYNGCVCHPGITTGWQQYKKSTWRNLGAFLFCKGSEIVNQAYKKNEYVIIPVSKGYLIININKQFKKGHTHVHEFDIARLLIDLAIKKELPLNPYFVDNLIRISTDSNYIEALKEFKEDSEDINFKKMMGHDSYYRYKGAIRKK